MNEELQTLYKIFNAKLFRIPDYQRGYAWTEGQLNDYWSDLRQIPNDGNHYTGVLTLEAVPVSIQDSWEEDQWIIKSKGFESFYIVDGQQRLTTSIILIQCIADTLLDDDDEINHSTKKEIQKKYLFDFKSGGISRSYIFGYEKDNPSYEYLKSEIFQEKSASYRKEETIYTNNLSFTKEFFNKKLSDLEREEISEIFKSVTQKMLFNIFSISKDVDVCVAFETMNNRGKPLSYLELLKNRLIYLSIKLEINQNESNDLRRKINDSWKTIYHNLGRNKNNPLDDDFFLRSHHFLNYIDTVPDKIENIEDQKKLSKITQSMNYPYYKSLLSDIFTFNSITEKRQLDNEADEKFSHQIHEYSISLQNSVRVWYKIFNPETTNDTNNYNFWLLRINRIKIDNVYPILLSIMIKTIDNKLLVYVFKSMERALFLSKMVGPYWGINDFSTNFLNTAIKLYRGEISIDDLVKKFELFSQKIISSIYGGKTIKETMKGKNYYSWKMTHYILFEYNNELQLNSKTERSKISWDDFVESENDYESIEHIYPQKSKGTYWKEKFRDLTTSKRDALRNVIGNLLPLSRPKNSSLSNISYPEKIKGRTPGTGYCNGSYAEIEVSQMYDQWTPETILDRSLQIIDFMEYRWGINFGSDNEKIEMLGLGFVRPFNRLNPRRFYNHDSHTKKLSLRKNIKSNETEN